MSGCVTVLCACGSAAEADAIATALVDGHLAACVQSMPVSSTYRWEGAVRQDGEHLLMIKTLAERVDAVTVAITVRHSYELPEITVLPIIGGSAGYLAWVAAESAATR